MKKCILIMITLVSLTLFADEKVEVKKDNNQKTILFLGDSLTAGYGVEKKFAYPSLLEEELNKLHKVKVLNGGVSGSTTASGISRLKWFLKANPDILVLILGANDGLRGIQVKESKKNLGKIIDLAKEKGLEVILAGMMLPPNYGKEYTTQFKNMYTDIKEKYGVKWIPFILEGVAGKTSLNIEDGIHPNKEGHKVIAKNLKQYLEPLL